MEPTLLVLLMGYYEQKYLAIGIVAFILFVCFYIWANTPTVMLSHWHHSFDRVDYSPEEIYTSAENAIKAKEIPEVYFERVTHWQEGLLYDRREYLRITKDRYTIDMCAAPFAKGFYVSWRLLEKKTFWREMVRKYPAFKNLADLKTYYQQDTEVMIKEYLHKGIMEAVDEMTKNKGIRALSDGERMFQDIRK